MDGDQKPKESKTTRVLISMNKKLLSAIDEKAEQTGMNRSELIRDAARFYLSNSNQLNLDKETVENGTEQSNWDD